MRDLLPFISYWRLMVLFNYSLLNDKKTGNGIFSIACSHEDALITDVFMY